MGGSWVSGPGRSPGPTRRTTTRGRPSERGVLDQGSAVRRATSRRSERTSGTSARAEGTGSVTGMPACPGLATVVFESALTEYDFGPSHPMSPVRVDLTMRLAGELGV